MMFSVLGRYFAWRFLQAVLGVFGGVTGLIYVIDMVETLRHAGETQAASGALMAWLALLHTPIISEQVLPFAVLIGSMIGFLNLSRRLELAVTRSAGVSVWQFLAPPLMVAVAIGIAEVTVYNPLSTAMKRRADTIEAQLFGGSSSENGGVWLSQRSVDGRAIIHAQGRAARNLYVHFQAFNFDPDGTFSQRVDAERAILRDGFWELRNATVVTPGFGTETAGVYLLATNLKQSEVSQAFSPPDTVSFWRLSPLAEEAENAGLDATAYRLRFQQLLALPATLASTVLIASCFSLRMFRMGGVQKMITGGVGAGFVLYVATKIIGDLGGVGALSPVVAGWLPAIVGSLIGVFVLLQLEDG